MPWRVLGENRTGTAHEVHQVECQDHFRYQAFGADQEWLAVAVADGAGSASLSQVGSTLACDELVRRVPRVEPLLLGTREALTGLFAAVRDVLIAESDQRGVPSRELACTILLAIVGPELAIFGQIGDGVIVVGDGPGFRAVFWPEPAEYANATDFLTDDRFAEALQFESIARPIAEIALLTDGLQRLALDYTARAPFEEFFRPLFRELRGPTDIESLQAPFRAFLDSPRVNERTDDDKTLVIASRIP